MCLPLLILLGAAPLGAHPEIAAALERLNARIDAAPLDAELYLDRGQLYAQHRDWISAEANYLRAAELAPRLARLGRARGALALATNRPAEARRHLDAALTQEPEMADGLVLRARAHLALGARDAALADLEAALGRLAAPPPELFLEHAALQPTAVAIRSLDTAIARIGPAYSLDRRALDLEVELGRFGAALARIDRILDRSDRKEIWLKERGDVLARAGRHPAARQAYAAALAEIAKLPAWLRASPETARLVAKLHRLHGTNP